MDEGAEKEKRRTKTRLATMTKLFMTIRGRNKKTARQRGRGSEVGRAIESLLVLRVNNRTNQANVVQPPTPTLQIQK